jgi:hypothetical protein
MLMCLPEILCVLRCLRWRPFSASLHSCVPSSRRSTRSDAWSGHAPHRTWKSSRSALAGCRAATPPRRICCMAAIPSLPTCRPRSPVCTSRQFATAPRSPWHNAYVARVIGSIPRECLDQVTLGSAAGLPRILTDYVAYDMRSRTRLALGTDAPTSRQVSPDDCLIHSFGRSRKSCTRIDGPAADFRAPNGRPRRGGLCQSGQQPRGPPPGCA